MNSDFFNGEIFIIPEAETNVEAIGQDIELLALHKMSDKPGDGDLLRNILQAVSFKMGENADVRTLEDGSSINVASIAPGSLKYIICFGLQPKEIGMNAGFRANTFYQTEGFKILLTHSLSQLSSEKKYKLALWNALQSEFKS